MKPLCVVVYFDIIEYLGNSVVLAFKSTLVDQLSFKTTEQRFCKGVVVWIIRFRHALNTLMTSKHLHAELIVFEKDVPKLKIGLKVRFTLANVGLVRVTLVEHIESFQSICRYFSHISDRY